MSNPYQQYQNNSIMTAAPGELTLMLYNGAIKFLGRGIEDIQLGKMKQAHQSLIRTQEIISELRITLDKKYEVAQEMDKIYEFIQYLLVQGNIKKDIADLNNALELIREFRDMWQQIIK